MNNDTIVAIATPRGVGGIAVVRLSGTQAESIALAHLSVSELRPRKATYCRFDELDDVVATFFPAPASYTGEATVELSCHGSLYVQQMLLQALINSGARVAEPGEFTLRAFRNGKLNLSQAEAVADLIDAVSPVQHRLAVSQLRGGYAQRLKDLRKQLVDLTSLLELELDFSQEDVEFASREQLRQLLHSLSVQVEELVGSFAVGNALRRGISVAIAGKPNVGKSSLLNALLNDDRAIVSDVAGTTRDTVEDTVMMSGTLFRFIDTAGLRQGADKVESLGIERSKRAVETADMVLYVHDATLSWEDPLVDLGGKQTILVLNKCDSPSRLDLNPPSAAFQQVVSVSALTGMGLEQLRKAMLKVVEQTYPQGDGVLITNARHYQALLLVDEALGAVKKGMEEGIPTDLLAVDLRDALYHIGTITGEVTSQEVITNIFSRFCIGK